MSRKHQQRRPERINLAALSDEDVARLRVVLKALSDRNNPIGTAVWKRVQSLEDPQQIRATIVTAYLHLYEAMFSLQTALASRTPARDVEEFLAKSLSVIPGRDAPLTGETPKEEV